MLVGLILLAPLPDLRGGKNKGVSNVGEGFWGGRGVPVSPHLDVSLGKRDHLRQDVGDLQVLQLIPLPGAL